MTLSLNSNKPIRLVLNGIGMEFNHNQKNILIISTMTCRKNAQTKQYILKALKVRINCGAFARNEFRDRGYPASFFLNSTKYFIFHSTLQFATDLYYNRKQYLMFS